MSDAPIPSNLVAYAWTGEGMILAVEGDRKRYYLASDIDDLLARRIDTSGWLDSHTRQMTATVVDTMRPVETTGELKQLRAALWQLKAKAKEYDGDLAAEVIRVCVRALLGSPEEPTAEYAFAGPVSSAEEILSELDKRSPEESTGQKSI